ncbi:MAG: type-4 uracil-DNA glycosylase [Nanopusillaceae archaeon]
MKKEEIEKLNSEILKCTRCPLYQYKKNYVPGDGDPNSEILFIGEAPGREEDLQGKPFVGKAGQVLNENIKNILNLDRNKVYITNVVKCRPPNNREPKDEEIKACSIWLEKQLEIIKPSIIVTLGYYSTKWIFEYFGLKFDSIMKNRGKIYKVNRWGKEIKIIPTIHPASTLYHREWRTFFDDDFKLIKGIIDNKEKSGILKYI